MISYLNVKQLEALAEIPSSLVINRNGTPNGTIFFKKLNKSAEPYYKIIEYLKKLTIPTIETYADISYIIGEICSQPRNKKSNVSRWLVISSKCYMNSYSLSIAPSWDSRQVTVEVHLEDIPNRVFLVEREDNKSRNNKFIYNFYQVSDTPVPPASYSFQNAILFMESCFRWSPEPKCYDAVVKNANFEELNNMRKVLSASLNVVKSQLIDLIQNDKTE